jgi:hypothetical protein
MAREPATIKVVKASLTDLAETAVPVALNQTRALAAEARAMRRRHRWMLLLAFEFMVFGFTQAVLRPIEPPGILVEQTLSPNHVVT